MFTYLYKHTTLLTLYRYKSKHSLTFRTLLFCLVEVEVFEILTTFSSLCPFILLLRLLRHSSRWIALHFNLKITLLNYKNNNHTDSGVTFLSWLLLNSDGDGKERNILKAFGIVAAAFFCSTLERCERWVELSWVCFLYNFSLHLFPSITCKCMCLFLCLCVCVFEFVEYLFLLALWRKFSTYEALSSCKIFCFPCRCCCFSCFLRFQKRRQKTCELTTLASVWIWCSQFCLAAKFRIFFARHPTTTLEILISYCLHIHISLCICV